jgi:hypothetical protein
VQRTGKYIFTDSGSPENVTQKQHHNPSVAVNPKAHMPKLAGCISARFMCSAKS